MTKIDTPKRTEAEMLSLLRKRHTSNDGTNGAWAFMTHVRDEASFNATRTIDALALGLWKSRGYEMHAFEVKVSRSDWLRELADPAKADRFIERVDRFWIVAAEGVAQPGEMPTGWGLLIAQGDGLRATVQAAKIPHTEQERLTTRSWLVCLLRAAGAVPKARPEDIQAAYDDGFKSGADSAASASGSWQRNCDQLSASLNALRDDVSAFERAAGFSIRRGHRDETAERAIAVGATVKAAINAKDMARTERNRLNVIARQLEEARGRIIAMAQAIEDPVEQTAFALDVTA